MTKRWLLIPEMGKELWYLDSEWRAKPFEDSQSGIEIRKIIQDILKGEREDPWQNNRSAQPWDFLVIEPWLEKVDFNKMSILIPERIWYTNEEVLLLLWDNDTPIYYLWDDSPTIH